MTRPPRVQRFASLAALLLGLLFVSPPQAAAGFVINEVLLRNDTLLDTEYLDEDGTRQAWVEIKNTGTSNASLLGWAISWSPTDPDRFVLPDVTLAAEETVVVWLSGKDRSVAGSPLHAHFTPARGSDLYLFDGAGDIFDSFVGRPVPIDHSMGRCVETGGVDFHYYRVPSPGEENSYLDAVPFVFVEQHVSLSAGQSLQLHVWPDVAVDWSSDNPNVTVSPTGTITASQDLLSPLGRARITATLSGGTFSRSLGVTIVGWQSNVSRVELAPQSVADRVLAGDASRTLYTVGTTLYASTNGLADPVAVGVLPVEPTHLSSLHETPFGNFFVVGTNVYHATDLSSWSLALQMNHPGLRHMFDTYWDAPTQTGYVFAGEYSSQDPTQRHAVYRGTYPNGGSPTWDTVLDFASLDDWTNDASVIDAVRHVHVVTVDPYTGDVYVATGDADLHSRIHHSKDFGSTFEIVGMGSQAWRTTSIWFTPAFVYWSMDTSAPQSVWRIARSEMTPGGSWPSITPELDSGTTTLGVEYYVTREDQAARFPVSKGELFVETGSTTTLDAGNTVRPLDDPGFDYREEVARIDNGAHWYQGFAVSEQGDLVSLLSAEPGSSYYRDDRARLIGIKEGAGGVPIVQELRMIEPELGDGSSYLTQLIPKAQGPDGFIYFASRKAAHERYQGRLYWYDDEASAPPRPTPPPAPDLCLPAPEPGATAMWATGLLGLGGLARRRASSRIARRSRGRVEEDAVMLPGAS